MIHLAEEVTCWIDAGVLVVELVEILSVIGQPFVLPEVIGRPRAGWLEVRFRIGGHFQGFERLDVVSGRLEQLRDVRSVVVPVLRGARRGGGVGGGGVPFDKIRGRLYRIRGLMELRLTQECRAVS